MSEITYIKGKDRCLEESIARMQQTLEQQGFDIQQVKWLNPVDYIFSLHIHDGVCPGLFTNGKGTSRKATLASALGEYLERLSTNYFFSDYYLTPEFAAEHILAQGWLYYPSEKSFALSDYRQCLSASLWSVYDPDHRLSAEDLLSFNDDSEVIRALELRHADRDEVVYFPANLLSNLYASNGLSAGNSQYEARVQGLSEIFERWVKNKILLENICLPEVPDRVLQQYPTVLQAIERLEQNGLLVSVRDASLGGVFPVMNVTLFDQKTGQCFASFGAHPLFEVALERSLTESLQGRHLDFLDGFQMPTMDHEAVAEAENLENHFIDSSGLIHARFISDQADYDFVHWNHDLATQAQWSFLVDLAREQGFEAYVADYSHYDFHACRIIVPGMSEVYPLDELEIKNQNDGRRLRLALDEFAKNSDAQPVLDLLDEVGFSDHQNVASLIGLMPDSGSMWAQMKICDLRFWLTLTRQDVSEALEALYVARAYVAEQDEMFVVYQAFALALEVRLEQADLGGYKSALTRLFGEALVSQVEQHLDGRAIAWHCPLGQETFKTSERHKALIQVYGRAQQAKQI